MEGEQVEEPNDLLGALIGTKLMVCGTVKPPQVDGPLVGEHREVTFAPPVDQRDEDDPPKEAKEDKGKGACARAVAVVPLVGQCSETVNASCVLDEEEYYVSVLRPYHRNLMTSKFYKIHRILLEDDDAQWKEWDGGNGDEWLEEKPSSCS